MNVPGSTSVFISIPSTGTPPASSARANSQAPGSCSCSIRKWMSQPRWTRSGRSCSRCASEPEMPATFWTWRTFTGAPPTSSTRSAQCPAEWPLLDARAQLAPEGVPIHVA